MRIKYHSIWTVRHWRKINGIWRLIWEEPDGVDRNILHDTGEIAILSAFFATTMTSYGAPPTSLYLGLDKRAALAEDDTLATLSELSKNGYERKVLAGNADGTELEDFYINQPGEYYRADSATVTWIAGEDWIEAVKNIFLATHLTATTDGDDAHLIASLALSAERTLLNGDKLEGSMYIGLSE